MSFALVMLQIVICILCCLKRPISSELFDGWWGTKTWFVVLMFVGSLWISSSFFNGIWLTIALAFSVVFMIYQALLMLFVSNKINQFLVVAYTTHKTICTKVTLLVVTILLIAGNLFWIVLQYT